MVEDGWDSWDSIPSRGGSGPFCQESDHSVKHDARIPNILWVCFPGKELVIQGLLCEGCTFSQMSVWVSSGYSRRHEVMLIGDAEIVLCVWLGTL